MIELEFTLEEAKELMQEHEGTPLADKISAAIDANSAAEAKRAESKKLSRQRNSANRKARLAQLQQDAAELKAAKEKGLL